MVPHRRALHPLGNDRRACADVRDRRCRRGARAAGVVFRRAQRATHQAPRRAAAAPAVGDVRVDARREGCAVRLPRQAPAARLRHRVDLRSASREHPRPRTRARASVAGCAVCRIDSRRQLHACGRQRHARRAQTGRRRVLAARRRRVVAREPLPPRAADRYDRSARAPGRRLQQTNRDGDEGAVQQGRYSAGEVALSRRRSGHGGDDGGGFAAGGRLLASRRMAAGWARGARPLPLTRRQAARPPRGRSGARVVAPRAARREPRDVRRGPELLPRPHGRRLADAGHAAAGPHPFSLGVRTRRPSQPLLVSLRRHVRAAGDESTAGRARRAARDAARGVRASFNRRGHAVRPPSASASPAASRRR